jgi:hypothetical protein
MASQLLGTSTLINGISFCPPCSKIRINTTKPVAHIEKVLAPDLFLTNTSDYRDSILTGAHRLASVIATLPEIPNTNTTLSLSGGMDSRVCLAAALAHSNHHSLFIQTNKNRQDDYVVARELGRQFNFDFKGPPREETVAKEQVPSWFLSNAGLYDPLSISCVTSKNICFRIDGGGAEVYKGNYGWRPLSAIKPAAVGHVSAIRPAIERYKAAIKPKNWGPRSMISAGTMLNSFTRLMGSSPKVEADISEAAYREASEGLRAVGIAAENPWATEWHYLCFRNAIHFGRTTTSSLLGISPLLQRDLVGLSRSSLNAYPAPKEGAPSIVTDLLIALNPELAMMPFDDPKKNMTSAYVLERSKFLGRVTNIEPYSIVGDPYAVNSGTPQIFLKLIATRGFKGNLTKNIAKQLAMSGFDAIPKEIRHAYCMPKYLAENELPEQIAGPMYWHYIAAGKLMAFLITV